MWPTWTMLSALPSLATRGGGTSEGRPPLWQTSVGSELATDLNSGLPRDGLGLTNPDQTPLHLCVLGAEGCCEAPEGIWGRDGLLELEPLREEFVQALTGLARSTNKEACRRALKLEAAKC